MQKARIKPVTGDYKLCVGIPKALRGDADNRLKCVSDFLVSREITPDDKHCQEFTIRRIASLVECEVEITPA